MPQVNKKLAFWRIKKRKWRINLKTLALTLVVHFFFFHTQIRAETNDWANLGLFYDRFPLTLSAGERTEVLGPLFSWEKKGTSSLFTFSPIFSLYQDKSIPQTEAELGYPVMAFDKFGEEYRFHIFHLINFNGGRTLNDEEKRRTTVFPFYFRQSSTNPEENYTAVVPFYGTIKGGRIFRDEISFVLLPLYVRTLKRGVVTENFLFPFFHLRQGAGVKGWQFWPLIGTEKKEITTTTNNWGDVNVVAGHKKFSALWPLYFNNTLGIGTTNQQEQFVLLPFYSSQDSPARTSKTYGFPIGYTHTIDRVKKYEEWDAPWPLVVFARGEGKHANRIWPFFSHAQSPTHETAFYAWPIYKYNRVTVSPLDRERTRILFFLYSDLIERNTVNQTALHRRDFWPLFTWRKDHQENTRLQVLSILEPILPNSKSIERVYSPAYSLYRYEKNAVTGHSSQSFLWNLFRYENRGESQKHSALFGLFQHEKTPERTKWRVLFIPFTKQAKN